MNNKINKLLFFLPLLFIILFSSLPIKGDEKIYLENVSKYFNNINEFTSSFLQIQNNDISEGFLSIKNKRLRIEYINPTKIVFVLKDKKAMYFNKDLQEVQYFNPKNTAGQFILDLFNKKKFLTDVKIFNGSGYFYLSKEIYIDESLNLIEVYFENKPFQLKKLKVINESGVISFTIINPNFNPNLDDKIFSLANPMLKS